MTFDAVGSPAVARRGRSTAEGTRERIVEAALQTLRTEGIVGTSARAIARAGDFNQALIFYHFGSVEEVLLAVVDRLSRERIERYHERLENVRTLPELVAVGAELHAIDTREGHILVLSQLLAGSVSSPEFGEQLRRRFDPWIELVETAVKRVIAGTPYENLVPVADLAFGVTALFMGIELLTHLEGQSEGAETLFRTIELMAGLLESLMARGEP